jgi:hypothetical protein
MSSRFSRPSPRLRTATRLIGISGTLLALVAAGTGSVSAAASTACPQGFETITVTEAVSEGYLGAARFDLNGDGTECRRALGDGIFHYLHPSVDTIYEWQDNVTPRGPGA